MIFQLAIELTATAEALAGVESNARFRYASGEHIEHGELLTANAARKTGARQAQRRTDGAHTHARQARQRVRRPAPPAPRARTPAPAAPAGAGTRSRARSAVPPPPRTGAGSPALRAAGHPAAPGSRAA